MADKAVLSRPIPKSNWDVVFTECGRYFFFDQDEKLATWIPPTDLLEILMKMPELVLQAFFDPDTDEDAITNMIDSINNGEDEVVEQVEFEFDVEEEDEVAAELEYDLEGEEEMHGEVIIQPPVDRPIVPLSPEEAATQHQAKATIFMNFLRGRNIDPFRPWSETSKELEAEPDFHAIASAKERESLFAVLCPELAERVRLERQQKLQEAQDAWKDLLGTMTDAKKLPATWTEYSRLLKKTAPWYKLLDAKEMEVQYRAKLKELRERAITYNVRSNK